MDRLQIKEALENLNAKEKTKVKLIDIGRELWPNSDIGTQRMNISNLACGKRTQIRIDYVPILCRVLKCDANFLFNLK
jgi:DNA-binding Xre family transcriptional regulator